MFGLARRVPAAVALLVILLGALGCSGDRTPAAGFDAATQLDQAADYRVSRPQTRNGIGDVDAVFERYADSRADLISLFQEQAWFQDGLTRDEALFVERSVTFVASYSGPRRAYVGDATIERKLYKYDKFALSRGELEVLLIYEPGQDAEREMRLIKQFVPVLESLVGVEYPERVMTVINGDFEVNDFNDGQFIRIARCCTITPFVLAHELAHTYWSVGPSWFNEGLADIYAVLAIDKLNKDSPAGWVKVAGDLESYFSLRRQAVESQRFPANLTLPRRYASDGLYEAADVFLLSLREAIGDEAFRSTARDLYGFSDFGRTTLREKRIQDIFLAHAKPSARDDVMRLFNVSIWGDDGQRYAALVEQESP